MRPSFIESGLLGATVGEASKLVPGILLSVAIVTVSISISDLANQVSAYKGLQRPS